MNCVICNSKFESNDNRRKTCGSQECMKARHNQTMDESHRKWRQAHREQCREYYRDYYQRNKHKMQKYHLERYHRNKK